MLEAQNLTFCYQDKVILDNFSLSLEKGSFTMLLGANGSGKSTVLRLLGGFLKPEAGCILVDGESLDTLKHFERARKIAVVPQNMPPVLDFTVQEMVTMGRLGNIPRFAPPGKLDQRIVREVMEKMEISSFADRWISQLSGGERQRVILAQALAAEPDYLLLDEPTSALDPEHVFLLMQTLQEISENTGILMVCHDLNLAWNFAKKTIILKDSKIFLAGDTRTVLTKENIRNAFDCDAAIIGNCGIILQPLNRNLSV